MVSQPQVNIEDRPAVTIAGIEIKATDDSQCPSAWVKLLDRVLAKTLTCQSLCGGEDCRPGSRKHSPRLVLPLADLFPGKYTYPHCRDGLGSLRTRGPERPRFPDEVMSASEKYRVMNKAPAGGGAFFI